MTTRMNQELESLVDRIRVYREELEAERADADAAMKKLRECSFKAGREWATEHAPVEKLDRLDSATRSGLNRERETRAALEGSTLTVQLDVDAFAEGALEAYLAAKEAADAGQS
jgi:hypothetical protein